MIFFRDPKREIGPDIVSPADGVIMDISKQEIYIRISIFMSIYHVHVNRMPIAGKILKMERIKGKYLPAFLSGSNKNAKLRMVIETDIGITILEQIAGIFAWRIVPYIQEGKVLEKGDKIGIIRFGSRVNLYLPIDKVEVCIKSRQHVKAGTSTLAKIIK